MTDLPEITEVQRVRLGPGDVIVARIQRQVSQAQIEDLLIRLKDVFKDNAVVIIAPEMGLDLEIVSPPAPAEDPEL